MAAILQKTHSNTFSWMKMSEFRLMFHWSLFLRVQITALVQIWQAIIWTNDGYRNWPWYGLRCRGWYCNPEQHELCRPSRGRAGRHNECCSGLQYQPRQRRPYKWSISILPRSQFTKSKGNLRFRRLVPLFVPIGVCVTTHDDGTASDVTISLWRHNQQATNHERNGKPWFSLRK